MPVITFIGAGSTVFARNLMADILSFEELAESTFVLHDIDEERLYFSQTVGEGLAQQMGAHPIIVTTTDRRHALDGADYVINMIQVGGYRPATVTDFEVPKKYGLRQTIGDTLGIGGIMRGLRTIPVLLAMAQDMEELCPDVLHLNYVNPMAMNCWALNRASSIHTIGLCHSVQHTAAELASDIGVPLDEITYLAAGINHMAFYLRFQRHGQDLYPEIHRVISEGRVSAHNRVRYEMLQRLGYFVTESSEHFAEYVPWFIKNNRPDLLETYNIPLDEYPGRCEIYARAWAFALEHDVLHKGLPEAPAITSLLQSLAEVKVMPSQREATLAALLQLQNEGKPGHSGEYGSLIIHSRETNTPRTVYGNVPNEGLIDNLPQGCIVEVPCLVDGNGVQPTRIGALPPQLAALMRTNINVQELTVEAALTGKREHIYHAAMLDPHTAAELDLQQIEQLVDDLIATHGDLLPAY